jgi:hypothetical protein
MCPKLSNLPATLFHYEPQYPTHPKRPKSVQKGHQNVKRQTKEQFSYPLWLSPDAGGGSK